MPPEGADVETDRVRVFQDRNHIKGAPNTLADHHLRESEEEELYRYYGLQSAGPSDAEPDHGAGARDLAGTEPVHTGRIRPLRAGKRSGRLVKS